MSSANSSTLHSGNWFNRALVPSLATILICAAAPQSHAQEYPSKPIHLVVSFPPGAGTDLVARVIAQEMQTAWGQQVIVENKPGAAGNIAAELVGRAAADGYTLLLVNSTFTANVGLFPNLPFNPLKDFVPVMRLGSSPMVIAAAANAPFDTLAGMVAAAKAKPGTLSYASCGNGGPPHIIGEQFMRLHGLDAAHIPYKGCGPATNDVLGGQVPVLFTNYSSTKAYLPSGRLKALAVTLPQRSSLAPEVPTVKELGFGDISTDLWFGLVAPAGTPAAIIEKLNTGIASALNTPSVKDKLMNQAVEPQPDTSAEFTRFLKQEIAMYTKLIKELNIKLD